MKEYVASFIFDLEGDKILLIRKKKPVWQSGLLNGIGGKIEIGEKPLQAIVREVKEEVNLNITTWKHFCSLEGDVCPDLKAGWKVHWFYTFTNKIHNFKNNTEEIAEIFEVKNLPKDTIANIPYLMHMALNFEIDRADFLVIKEINY